MLFRQLADAWRSAGEWSFVMMLILRTAAVATVLALAMPALADQPPEPTPPILPTVTAPGALLVVADADGTLVLIVTEPGKAPAERQLSLKKGDNRFEVPAGQLAFKVDPARGLMQPSELTLEAGGEARAVLTTRGRVSAALTAEGASLEVDGKQVAAKDGKATAEFAAGPHSVVVRRPGYYGSKGAIDVPPGRTTELSAQLEHFDGGGNRTLAWTGIIGGGVLVAASIAIDATSRFDELGGDATRWGMMTVGLAGFVGGTILLKSIIDDEATPPVRDGRIDVKLAGLPGGAMAQLAGSF